LKTLFIDTSAFYALFNRDDRHHQEASHFYQEQSCIFITTQTVFIELLSLITKRLSKKNAIQHGQAIKASHERFKIIVMNEDQAERAWELFCKHKDKDYDLVDCLSFVCMKDLHITEAFTFDHHFAQAGFAKIP